MIDSSLIIGVKVLTDSDFYALLALPVIVALVAAWGFGHENFVDTYGLDRKTTVIGLIWTAMELLMITIVVCIPLGIIYLVVWNLFGTD